MLTTLRAQTASFDLVIAPGDVVQSLIDEELIQQLDASRIPNQANITVGPQVISVPLDYLVPYQWGTIGIAYDTTIVSEPITSWDGFLAYEGRVAWVDDGRLMLSIALSKLGYPLASIDEAQLQEAADYLLTVPNNDVFAVSANNQTNLLLQGEVDAIVDRSRNVLRLIQDCECEDFAYSLPEDGFLAYYDAMVVPANAQNATLAHAFMDYILVPQVNANLSNALGSATPVIEAYALVDEAILNNGVSYVTAEFLQAYLSGEAVVVEQYGQRLDLYLDEWTRVKGELVN